ncbi:uncharacterized protein NECHADRAFT_85999 [Fusarium vanettenii 77-13-4]|uniref:Uncharacterized protein n=1 Tax=Fusarium vanettenii (strain ATCC MYA-4622 / CBS 123669 / FGSC 9596 / NRRL 45880 / 77-13-4) TaxID=660122 RepID=C7Z224_FUSV7|nr:uncharacterized protein NECHADRAFT_85999 [Fusarium vanettenii 77-13-4]EEU42100.1 predicted protein [Fusarium vanettenii 77-13-4]
MAVIHEVLLFPSSISITTTEPAEACFNRLFSCHVLFVVESMTLLAVDCLKNRTTKPSFFSNYFNQSNDQEADEIGQDLDPNMLKEVTAFSVGDSIYSLSILSSDTRTKPQTVFYDNISDTKGTSIVRTFGNMGKHGISILI